MLEHQNKLGSSSAGLSQTEAEKRLALYGPNEFPGKKTNMFLKFLGNAEMVEMKFSHLEADIEWVDDKQLGARVRDGCLFVPIDRDHHMRARRARKHQPW